MNLMKTILFVLLSSGFASAYAQTLSEQQPDAHSNPRVSINGGWKFIKLSPTNDDSSYHSVDFDDESWVDVHLPHTSNIEPLVVNDQWQGISWYRKQLFVPNAAKDMKVFVEFEAAMNTAKIWVNGRLAYQQMGGYLPVNIDLTEFVSAGKNNLIAVQLDNRDNPVTGPKPLKTLDFNMYGGLYRNGWLSIKNNVYISNPNLVDEVAGGGVFVTTPVVGAQLSTVEIKTHVMNDSDAESVVSVNHEIFFDGNIVATTVGSGEKLAQESSSNFHDEINIQEPRLWSPDEPNLYLLKTQIMAGGKLVDEQSTSFGIREFTFKGQDLYINGKQTYLRGVNRHQEYPYVGYALSDNAQYRDAMKIKQAGFDFVRLSHYPQSPAFLTACDELGIVVLNAMLGWQYYADTDAFREHTYNSGRLLIRRDRNHPSVLAWELSLNETKMPDSYMVQLHEIVHSELPGDNVYSAGWIADAYDIYLQSRQHKIRHGIEDPDQKPYLVSEYGDWEYHSNNPGLNQHKMPKDLRIATSSRQLRQNGEKALLQQAANMVESHNDNLSTPAFADGYWVMYDYNRGYHPDIESSGVMDIFRLPKIGYYFYKSQRSPITHPMVKIGSYWTEESPLNVKVFSNAEEVSLFLNNQLIAKQSPDNIENTKNLLHPPFTFKLPKFESGTLKAVAKTNGKVIAEDVVQTPSEIIGLKVWIDESGRKPVSGQNDVVFAHIAAIDKNGTVIPDYSKELTVQIDGNAAIINPKQTINAEAGIGTAVIRIGDTAGQIQLQASDGQVESNFSFEVSQGNWIQQ